MKEIAVIRPGESLARQVSLWAAQHSGNALRLVPGTDDNAVLEALLDADFCVIDATTNPARAQVIAAAAVELMDPARVLVYSEAADPELEIAFRSARVMFTVGPMPDAQWEAVLPHPHRKPPWAA